jgi:restriction system protein
VAKKLGIWRDCGFTTYADHVDGEPESPTIISILYFSVEFNAMLEGSIRGWDTFLKILSKHGFWYSQATSDNLHFYVEDDSLLESAFAEFARWQWICSLIQPDFADVSEELYQHFVKRPQDLENLHWRQFEILLFRIFQARGFKAELGPGSNDGGVDIRLLQRDPIGDMLTLVQVKRYHPTNKIGLEAVQALHGAAAVEQAPKSLFVTTSSYLPSAKKFANRTSGALDLCTSQDVVDWCAAATAGIIQDKSQLVASSQVSRILREVAQKPDVRVVHASTGVTMILNRFALVIKESEHAALLMGLPNKTITGDALEGTEVPILNGSALDNFGSKNVWRAKRKVRDGKATYWDGKQFWSSWSGRPEYFTYLD